MKIARQSAREATTHVGGGSGRCYAARRDRQSMRRSSRLFLCWPSLLVGLSPRPRRDRGARTVPSRGRRARDPVRHRHRARGSRCAAWPHDRRAFRRRAGGRAQCAARPGIHRRRRPRPGREPSDRQAMPVFAELNARRDIVFVDQRGTGRSNALDCPDDESLAAHAGSRPADCKTCSAASPTLRGDTRQYATWIAVRDYDAVASPARRRSHQPMGRLLWHARGARVPAPVPQQVRTVVLDGVAPPDMVLPAAFSVDADAALAALAAACSADARCRARYPDFDGAHRGTAGTSRVRFRRRESGIQ